MQFAVLLFFLQILSTIALMEQSNPTSRPAKSRLVSGTWRLLWSQQAENASPLQKWGSSQSKNYQVGVGHQLSRLMVLFAANTWSFDLSGFINVLRVPKESPKCPGLCQGCCYRCCHGTLHAVYLVTGEVEWSVNSSSGMALTVSVFAIALLPFLPQLQLIDGKACTLENVVGLGVALFVTMFVPLPLLSLLQPQLIDAKAGTLESVVDLGVAF
jgi:hypothetical protein